MRAAHAMVAWTLDGATGDRRQAARQPKRAREAIRHARLAARLADEDPYVLATAGHVLTYLGTRI